MTRLENGWQLPTIGLGGTKQSPKIKPVDELLLQWLAERTDGAIATFHDEQGVLTTHLHDRTPVHVSDNLLHHERIRELYAINSLTPAPIPTAALDSRPPLRYAVMRMPKYPDLFEWYLNVISRVISADFSLAVGFQTRHFTPKLLTIASRYARTVTQSRGYKRARTLVLGDWVMQAAKLPCHTVEYREKVYRQYYGVFSAGHIDYGTQYLLDTWKEDPALQSLPTPNSILDVGVGNGVIGDQLLLHHYPEAALCGTDVSHNAVASASMNLPPRADVRWASTLDAFQGRAFDLIVTNPPFHDGHRNTTRQTTLLFRQAAERLSPTGTLVVVSNRHLNYGNHLRDRFERVACVAANGKFEITLAQLRR